MGFPILLLFASVRTDRSFCYNKLNRLHGGDGLDAVLQWLLEGDVSLQYLTHRYLLGSDADTVLRLQNRIPSEGYGAAYLARQNGNGHWGIWYYQPKWTSTHYTLLELKNIGIPADCLPCRIIAERMLDECMLPDGGLNLAKSKLDSDICVDGMALRYTAYFLAGGVRLKRLVDHLLDAQKPDGGFSWNPYSVTGDPHTTICVLEGLSEYCASGTSHRANDIIKAQSSAVSFLLRNGLFFEGDARYRMLAYPFRYRYDLLRALDYFALQDIPFSEPMRPALRWLQSKQTADGFWNLELEHKGAVHFPLETRGLPSRFITLKALYILRHFQPNA